MCLICTWKDNNRFFICIHHGHEGKSGSLIRVFFWYLKGSNFCLGWQTSPWIVFADPAPIQLPNPCDSAFKIHPHPVCTHAPPRQPADPSYHCPPLGRRSCSVLASHLSPCGLLIVSKGAPPRGVTRTHLCLSTMPGSSGETSPTRQ